MIRHLFGRDARAGIVAGGSAAYANAVLIGLPLLQTALGPSGTVFLIVVVAIHLPVMMLASMVLNELVLAKEGKSAGTASLRDTLRHLGISLALHPILIGIAAGLLWRATGFGIPLVVAKVIDPLAQSAGALALFASGMALMNYGIARQVRPAIAISALKLFLLPALVFAASQAIGLSSTGIVALTLAAACPTGVNAFLVASRLGTGQALASNTLLISTAAGVATVTMWVSAMQGLQ